MLNKEPLAGSDAGEVVVSVRLYGFVKATGIFKTHDQETFPRMPRYPTGTP